MWFWVKHLSLAVILIAAAIYFLFGSGPVMDMKDTKNAAAQGLSRFYAALRNQVNDKNNERDKYVLKLPTPETSLDVALFEREKVVEPSSPNWTGDIVPRRFENGTTLKDVLSDYARNEDIVLYWYLSKDYVVKDHFRVDSNFVSALYQVGAPSTMISKMRFTLIFALSKEPRLSLSCPLLMCAKTVVA